MTKSIFSRFAATNLLIASFLVSAQQVDQIILWERNISNPFFYATIENAAQLTVAEYGEFEIAASPKMEQGRAFVSLSSGQLLNVAIAGISSKNESLGKAVYIPIDRGLLGFRLCMTNSEHSGFSDVHSLADFRKQNYTVGVGSHWPDRSILEVNGFVVAHSPVYEHLFAMLKAGRFDCFLRSVNEIDIELKNFNEDDLLSINQDIAFVYPMADFVFVSPAHARLFERIELGLQRSLENGSFNELFRKYHGDDLITHQYYSRNIIILNNPDVSINALDAINLHGIASFAQSYVKAK